MSEITELRGVKCKVYNRGKNDSYVVHADRDIGITIYALKTDTPNYCINKESFFRVLKEFPEKNRIYHDAFSLVLKCIENKKQLPDIVISSVFGLIILNTKHLNCSVSSTCAFNKQ